MRGGGDGHDGGSPSGGGSEGNAGGDKGGDGKNGGNNNGSGNDGFGGGFGGGEGGGDRGGGNENGRGPGSDTGQGRRDSASSAFGGLSSDDGNLAGNTTNAGKTGSANNTSAGQSSAEGSPNADMSFGLRDAVTANSKNYGGIAPTGFQGYGIGDSMPGVSTTTGKTAQQRSRGTKGLLSGGFDQGYGLDKSVSELSKSQRGLGQIGYEGEISKGANLAANVAQASAVPGVGGVVNIAGGLYSKTMSPTAQRSYQDVRNQGINSALASGIGIAGQYAGIPSQVTNAALGVASGKMQADYAATEYGYSPSQTRRSNALSAFSGDSGRATNTQGLLGPARSSNYGWWQPSSFNLGQYGGHTSKLGY